MMRCRERDGPMGTLCELDLDVRAVLPCCAALAMVNEC